ncbi:glycosyltransferase, partial [filamentous cyanobacterium CCP5]
YEQVQPYLAGAYDLNEAFKPQPKARHTPGQTSRLSKILKKIKRKFSQITPTTTPTQTPLAEFVAKANIDFLYPIIYYNFDPSILPLPCAWAGWIPDFQHKYLTHFFSDQEIAKRDRGIQLLAEAAPKMVFSSASAVQDYERFYPAYVHKANVLSFRTIPSADWYSAAPLAVQKQYSLPDRFFIICNQFWQHKNHLLVFEALALLKARSIFPTVVCTGKLADRNNPDYIQQIYRKIEDSGLADQVHLLGLIPRLDQIQLIRRSLALIQPSLFEGWSTSIEDARVLGKPMVLSDFPVHLEQNPPNTTFFQRQNAEDLAHTLENYWKKCVPGPSLLLEDVAKENNAQEVKAFALRFLDIARSPI